MIRFSRLLSNLRQHELFATVDPSLLESAAQGEIVCRCFEKGEALLFPEAGEAFCVFLLSGAAVFQSGERDQFAERRNAGELFGVQALFLNAQTNQSVLYAVRKTQAAAMTKTFFLRLMQNDSGFSLGMIRFLSARVALLERRVTTYTGGCAQNRLARFLLDALGDYKTVALDRSMQQLAVTLDISRPSLYRAFEELESLGAIERNGRFIRLVNKETLTQCCEAYSRKDGTSK